MLISITGRLGSGKSTICGILKEKYGFDIFSTGTINREFARSLGITTLELNERLKEDPELDKQIDGTVTRLSIEKKDEKLIFDSRMAWHFAKDTFKIFLTIDPMEAAQRVMKNQRGAEEHYDSVEDACAGLVKRGNVERERFIQIYGVDYFDHNNYDLIVDTTSRTPDEIVNIIIENYNEYCADKNTYKSPKEL
jgi:cytidylate kinase